MFIVLCTVLSTFHVVTKLISTRTLGSRYCSYHIRDDDIETILYEIASYKKCNTES